MIKKKLTDYAQKEGFNLITSALLTDNKIDPNCFAEFFPDMIGKYPYYSFKNLFKDFEVLDGTNEFIKKINENKDKKFVICADYDCDGIMSAVILEITLQKLNIDVDFVVPDRLNDGYGMSESLIDEALGKGAEILITVDNGISCKDSINYAKSKGLDVIVTDHHIPTECLIPEDILIIDPSYSDAKFKGICGAFVVCKLAYQLLKNNNLLDDYFLDEIGTLAGIATVTDMMPLISENRLLLRATLHYIDFIKSKNIWNRVMKIVSGLGGYTYLKDPTQLADIDLLSFQIGPTINAVGRVNGKVNELIQNIIDCSERGVYINKEFSQFNLERKRYTKEILKAHEKTDEPVNIEILDEHDYAFPISGLLGLMANKLVNEENKPSLIGFKSEGLYEFSCRSIPGYSIHDAFERIKNTYPDLNLDGGGHASAMGLRFPATTENLALFREALTEDFINNKSDIIDKSAIELGPDTLEEVVSTLESFFIFGSGFKAPKFIYTGVVHSFNSETKCATIGDYNFKLYVYNGDALLGKTLTVVFTIKFDSTLGAYFKVDLEDSNI